MLCLISSIKKAIIFICSRKIWVEITTRCVTTHATTISWVTSTLITSTLTLLLLSAFGPQLWCARPPLLPSSLCTRILATLVPNILMISWEQRLLLNRMPLSRAWVISYVASDCAPLTTRHCQLLWGSSLVFSSIWLRWLSQSLLTTFQKFIHAVHLCSPLHTSHDTTSSPYLVSCPLSPCVCHVCIFVSSLHYTLRSYWLSKYCTLSSVNHSDLCWLCHFLP